MKSKLAYWIPTVLLGLMMTMSGLMAVTRQPPAVEGYTHLGYPLYFLTILGTAKLLGVATLLVPGLPRLKEWAYAGFMINLVSAVASHLAVGDPLLRLASRATQTGGLQQLVKLDEFAFDGEADGHGGGLRCALGMFQERRIVSEPTQSANPFNPPTDLV